MTALFNDLPVPLAVQIAAVEREIDMRSRVYPRWVSERRLTQTKADYEMAAMRAVLTTLKDVQRDRDASLPSLAPIPYSETAQRLAEFDVACGDLQERGR